MITVKYNAVEYSKSMSHTIHSVEHSKSISHAIHSAIIEYSTGISSRHPAGVILNSLHTEHYNIYIHYINTTTFKMTCAARYYDLSPSSSPAANPPPPGI